MRGLRTEDGIADIGFAWAAWIIDPGENALGVLQTRSLANNQSRGPASSEGRLEDHRPDDREQ
jgi:hypothetical protein